jgi:hypothetical protein
MLFLIISSIIYGITTFLIIMAIKDDKFWIPAAIFSGISVTITSLKKINLIRRKRELTSTG